MDEIKVGDLIQFRIKPHDWSIQERGEILYAIVTLIQYGAPRSTSIVYLDRGGALRIQHWNINAIDSQPYKLTFEGTKTNFSWKRI